eukprot:42906-Chlamydomonas_euryale.AAC.2
MHPNATHMLTSFCATAEHTGGADRVAREYIEDVVTGDFYKLDDPGLLRKLAKLFAKHQARLLLCFFCPSLTPAGVVSSGQGGSRK